MLGLSASGNEEHKREGNIGSDEWRKKKVRKGEKRGEDMNAGLACFC